MYTNDSARLLAKLSDKATKLIEDIVANHGKTEETKYRQTGMVFALVLEMNELVQPVVEQAGG